METAEYKNNFYVYVYLPKNVTSLKMSKTQYHIHILLQLLQKACLRSRHVLLAHDPGEIRPMSACNAGGYVAERPF